MLAREVSELIIPIPLRRDGNETAAPSVWDPALCVPPSDTPTVNKDLWELFTQGTDKEVSKSVWRGQL